MQYVSHAPPQAHTLTIKKTHYQRAAQTQFHKPINTAFALITILASWSDQSYQEDVHYCQTLSDGSGFLALHKFKTSQREQVTIWGNVDACMGVPEGADLSQ